MVCTALFSNTTPRHRICTQVESTNNVCTLVLAVLRCPSSIPNGQLEKTCSFQVGATCSFTCFPGYGSTTTRTLQCGRDQKWNVDVRSLCGGEFIEQDNHGVGSL